MTKVLVFLSFTRLQHRLTSVSGCETQTNKSLRSARHKRLTVQSTNDVLRRQSLQSASGSCARSRGKGAVHHVVKGEKKKSF